MSDMPYVETFPAGEFVCDKCGRNSFFSLINVESELTLEELDDFYSKVHGKKPLQGTKGFWMMHPLTVVCQHCQEEYGTFEKEMEDGVGEEGLQ